MLWVKNSNRSKILNFLKTLTAPLILFPHYHRQDMRFYKLDAIMDSDYKCAGHACRNMIVGICIDDISAVANGRHERFVLVGTVP